MAGQEQNRERDYTPLAEAPNYNRTLQRSSTNHSPLSGTWASFSSFFSRLVNSLSTRSLPNLPTAETKLNAPLLRASDSTLNQFEDVWRANKPKIRSMRQSIQSQNTQAPTTTADGSGQHVVLQSITVSPGAPLSDPSVRLHDSLQHLTDRLQHSLQKGDWAKARTIQTIIQTYVDLLTTTRSDSPVGLNLDDIIETLSNSSQFSDLENPSDSIIEAIVHFPNAPVPPSLLLRDTTRHSIDPTYEQYARDIENWIKRIPTTINQLEEQSRTCTHRSLQAGKNALLWIFAILKATSSAANIIGASPYSWYPYIAAPLNLGSTGMTRSRAILKADRTLGWLIPSDIQSLQLPIPPSSTRPSTLKSGEWSVIVPALLAALSFPGVCWDAMMASKGWENTCEWVDNPNITEIISPLRYPIAFSAGLSALVFNWIKVRPTVEKLITRERSSRYQLILASLVAIVAATASVTQFWKLAEDSQKDNDFYSPLLFWIGVIGKFSMSASAQIAKLLDVLAKPWTFKRWNLFPEGSLSLCYILLCAILLADNTFAAGLLTLTGTNQFLNTHFRDPDESVTISEDAFASLTMIVAFATQYVFAVIPASRQLAVDEHKKEWKKIRPPQTLFQHNTAHSQDASIAASPYATPAQA